MQNLFDLCYYSHGGEIVPTGWHVSDDKELPYLSSRIPQSMDEEDGEDLGQSSVSDAQSSPANNEDDGTLLDGQTRMNDESEDELALKVCSSLGF
jgi:hypothetical protein